MGNLVNALGGIESLLVVGGIGFLIYYLYTHGLLPKNTGPLGLGWPGPGQTGQNIGGQTVGTTANLGTQYNIHTAGFLGTGDLWTVFPPDGGNPIVDINANTTPVGPSGQSIATLQAAGWSNQDIADMIGMGGIQAPGNLGPGAPVGGASGSY